ncbi:MAG: hypothetical protein ACXAC8_17410 [Candidatus Hodarchaeales archaeon]|jgi:hypothetical protein
MVIHYYLERKTEKDDPEVLSLGVFSLNRFFPAMPHEVFKILVAEAQFKIQDEKGNEFTIENFEETINHTFKDTPPVISLNAS